MTFIRYRFSMSLHSCLFVLLAAGKAGFAFAQGPQAFGELTRPSVPLSPSTTSSMQTSQGAYSSASGSEDAQPYICALYDAKNKRCLVREMTSAQRESAISTGVEVAASMMQIQQDALRRAQMTNIYSSGAYPSSGAYSSVGATQPSPRATTYGRSNAPAVATGMRPGANLGADRFAACIEQALERISQQTGSNPTDDQHIAAMRGCGQ